jgi:chromosome segregation ATPase
MGEDYEMQFKSKFITIFFVTGITFGLGSCVTNRSSANDWEDAALVSRQQTEIEQLRRDIADLRSQLGNAQQATQSSIESIDRAYTELESSLAGTANLQNSINALTEFAKRCLAEIDRLRKYQSENIGIQSTDRGTNAGTR